VAIFAFQKAWSTWEDALGDPFSTLNSVEAGRTNPDRDMIVYPDRTFRRGEDCQSRIDDVQQGEEGELDEEAMWEFVHGRVDGGRTLWEDGVLQPSQHRVPSASRDRTVCDGHLWSMCEYRASHLG
jgi:hypothetical protein